MLFIKLLISVVASMINVSKGIVRLVEVRKGLVWKSRKRCEVDILQSCGNSPKSLWLIYKAIKLDFNFTFRKILCFYPF